MKINSSLLKTCLWLAMLCQNMYGFSQNPDVLNFKVRTEKVELEKGREMRKAGYTAITSGAAVILWSRLLPDNRSAATMSGFDKKEIMTLAGGVVALFGVGKIIKGNALFHEGRVLVSSQNFDSPVGQKHSHPTMTLRVGFH